MTVVKPFQKCHIMNRDKRRLDIITCVILIERQAAKISFGDREGDVVMDVDSLFATGRDKHAGMTSRLLIKSCLHNPVRLSRIVYMTLKYILYDHITWKYQKMTN